MYTQLGVSPPRGFLLHGPPGKFSAPLWNMRNSFIHFVFTNLGCGKTLLAHAIAGVRNIVNFDVLENCMIFLQQLFPGVAITILQSSRHRVGLRRFWRIWGTNSTSFWPSSLSSPLYSLHWRNRRHYPETRERTTGNGAQNCRSASDLHGR